MPFRICKQFEIESGHMLSKHPGKCRFPHGHSRRVEVVLIAEELDANDMVCDFKALKHALEGFLETWDHALCLNSNDPHVDFYTQHYRERVVLFPRIDPTSEVLAQAVFREAQQRLQAAGREHGEVQAITANVRVERVRVTETSSSWAEYFE